MQVTTSGVRERGNNFREETIQADPSENQVAWIVRAQRREAGGPGAYSESGKRVGFEGDLDRREEVGIGTSF